MSAPDGLTPQPARYVACGECNQPFILRRVDNLYDLRTMKRKPVQWVWMRDCKCKRVRRDRVMGAPTKPTPRRFSAQDRELAAVRSSILADHWSRGHGGPYSYDFQPTSASRVLSEQAFVKAERNGDLTIAETWAEAEALIRTGWTP